MERQMKSVDWILLLLSTLVVFFLLDSKMYLTDVEFACLHNASIYTIHTRSGVIERKKAGKKAGRKRPYTTNHFKWAFTNRVRVQKDILPIIQANDNPLLWLKCYNLMREHLKMFLFPDLVCFSFFLLLPFSVDAFRSVFRIQLNFKVATLTASCEWSGKKRQPTGRPTDHKLR